MQIKSLSIKNLKGLNVQDVYGSETLIIGRNFAGKTARLQAIQLALIGYITGVSKTNPDIFALASSDTMEVVAMCDQDTYTRRFKKSGKSVSRSDSAPDATDSILAMMDASKFLASSGPEKLAMIFNLAQITSDETPATLLAKMPFGIQFPTFKVATGAVKDWIEQALPHAKQQLLFAKQGVDRMGQTQQGMVALTPEVEPTLPVDYGDQVSRLEGEKKALEKRTTELQVASENYVRDKRNYESNLQSWKYSEERRAADMEKISNRPTVVLSIESLKSRLAKPAPDLDGAEIAVRDYADEMAKQQAVINEAMKNEKRANDEIEELDHMEACPYCKSKGKTWKKTLRETLTEQATSAHQIRTSAEHALKQATDGHGIQVQHRDAVRSEIAVRNEASAQLRLKEQELVALDSIKTELAKPSMGMPTEPQAPEDTAEEEMNIDRELQEAQEKLDALYQLEERAGQVRARNATSAQAQLKAEETMKEKAAWEGAVKVLEDERQTLVDGAFKCLLDAATPVYDGILDAPLAYVDGVIGRTRPNGQWVPFVAFSGTEALVATIAIQVALGAKSPARIVLLDEMGRLDADNKNRLVTNLHGMVKAGQIDQWIAIDVTPPNKKHPEITVIYA